MLIDAKKAVPHGDWADLVSKLEFDESTTQRLMKIARDPRLSNPAILPLLPQQWTQLYALSKCKTDEHFERKLSEIGQPRTARPKPTVTDAEYHEVKKSPVGTPVDAVSTSDRVDSAGQSATPQDDCEGGDSVVTESPDDADTLRVSEVSPPAGGAEWKPPHFDPQRQVPQVPPGMVAYSVDLHDPVSALANGLAMAMAGSINMSGLTFAQCYPEDMALLSDDITKFIEWLYGFEDAFRARYNEGNEAGLQAAE
jgi:hypothetical protein